MLCHAILQLPKHQIGEETEGHSWFYCAATGKGNVVRIWDIVSGQELLSLDGHRAQFNALSFSPDGLVLASCDHQGKVKLWRADWPGLAIPR